jgi:hypothetical protein
MTLKVKSTCIRYINQPSEKWYNRYCGNKCEENLLCSFLFNNIKTDDELSRFKYSYALIVNCKDLFYYQKVGHEITKIETGKNFKATEMKNIDLSYYQRDHELIIDSSL